MKPLPPDTVRLLSSAQVITSVGNVVKELLENSVDAGATSLDIKMENYGLDRIEVRDNGLGIQACDTVVMAVRHYTSKISCHDDLERLDTYGFRGEALGSICAVAEVSITTKTVGEDISTQYSLDVTGKVVSQKPSHLGQGTTVTVLKLFKNLPVRRQYYTNAKKCKEELKKVQDLLMAYAIVKPDLRLTLAHNKVVMWQKTRAADLRGALLATLGSGVVAHLLPCQHLQEQPQISLDGFFPKPGADYLSTSSSSHDKTFIFINNRPVQQKDIMKLLRQSYTAQYPSESNRNRYPVLVLQITLPPSSIDVNLTPDKTQVLLHNKEAVLVALEALLVSLYGFRSPNDATPAERDSTYNQPPSPPQADTSPAEGNPRTSESGVKGLSLDAGDEEDPKTIPEGGVPAPSTGNLRGDGTSLDHPTTTNSSSSSSSIAEDWIINHISGGLLGEPHDDNATLSGPGDAQGELFGPVAAVSRGSAADGRPTLSAESWSRGVALTHPASGAPLQPVQIHRSGDAASGPQGSPGKKLLLNAVTENRASLTAYDLISNRTARAPLSAAAMHEKEARAEVLRERPAASLQEISDGVQERWKNLREEERTKYEEKAKKHLVHHGQRTILAAAGGGREAESPSPSRQQGLKRKAPLANQQLLDQLFSPQPQKKKTPAKPPDVKPSRPLPFSVAGLRQGLRRLWSQSSGPPPSGPANAPPGPRLVNRLAPASAWVVLCGRELMLLNPFRVEEALLFKRLLENNILAAVALQNPIQLTDGLLGGSEYTQALCNMAQGIPELNGGVILSDPRLLANGFKIRLFPGSPSAAPSRLEVTALADCVPFLGVEALREILTGVLRRTAATVQDSRPLKVRNYLQGEAVRLARQLPSNMTRQEVEESLSRMTQLLREDSRTCIHGRPFLHQLSVVPGSEHEAKSLLLPIEEL
ncbi:PMS1 protein homolog 1 [Gadus morhua]|uniref:PMS1 homolog 1, mismatch repair system component n=1 Tax=Gadus morhua TaxID=8049 RepID=A0A8C5C1B6_GADMO|nr:PMS1 protein homolog 1 [Gadus morhua]XP_030198988.1 PMS1 protein homolog 1 [Gadus morhua]XP_030198989.1 PMS1 protein homolog 1 [Gadus morhua]